MNSSILRLLDANANRAREALRVMEDYARFVLADQEMCRRLKELRHELAGALGPVTGDAILHRDTPGDVGTGNKTESELAREDLAHVVTAAGKRLGEALRCLEEFAKIDHPGLVVQPPGDVARRIEAIRYRFYDIEQVLARTLRPGERFANVRLYVLITEKLCQRPWLPTAEEAIAGGADCLQLREKELDGGELLARARTFVQLCRQHGVISIINDRADIALLSGADGVHVGQGDLPAAEVRKLVGRQMILGVSTQRIEQARQAVLDGADYIGVGPMFPSTTKARDFVAGPEYARQIAAEIHLPAIAIGGITEANVDELVAAGVRAVAVTAAVISCPDPRGATERLKKKLMEHPRPVGQASLSVSTEHLCPSRWDRHSCLSSGGVPAPLVGQTSPSVSGGTDIPVCHPEVVEQTFLSVSPAAPGSTDKDLKVTHRKLPHWTLQGATYFLTFRTACFSLDQDDRAIVLQHIRFGHQRFYSLIAAVVMPDHVHVLLQPNPGVDLPRIMKGIKGVSAHLLNQRKRRHGQVWQDESFDRIIRDQAELDEKLQYMLNNPAKRGLVEDPWQWDGWFYVQ